MSEIPDNTPDERDPDEAEDPQAPERLLDRLARKDRAGGVRRGFSPQEKAAIEAANKHISQQRPAGEAAPNHVNTDLRNKLSWIDRQINELWAMIRRSRPQQQASTDGGFYAKITSTTRDGGNWRWTYQMQEVTKTSTGFGGWTNLSGGRVGTAYNTIEASNGGAQSSLLGNGVTVSNLGNLQPQPAPVGVIVRMYALTIGTLTEYSFSYENGIDGQC